METRLEIISKALDDYDNGVFKSIRAAAKAYKLPKSTLQGRSDGRETRLAAHEAQKRLTSIQKDILTEWIIVEDSYGRAPTIPQVREAAAGILDKNGDHKELGKQWIKSFKTRNPRVHSRIGRRLDSKRAQGATPEAINAFFDRLRSILAKFSIRSEDVWNMDESGLELGLNSNTTVLTESTKKRAFVSTPINREWVTSIETVSARGSTTEPVILFKGKYVMESWLAQFRPDWHFRCSPKG